MTIRNNPWTILVALGVALGMTTNARATSDSFFDIYLDLWDDPYLLEMTSAPVQYDSIQTEMLSMDLSSAGPPNVTELGNGNFRVDSFFDVHYEAGPPGSTATFDVFFDVEVSMEFIQTETSSNRRSWDTEILSMDLSGVAPDGGSDTRPRLSVNPDHKHRGHVTILKLAGGGGGTVSGGGQFQVDSFFDIFTELSVDGGNNYHPTNPPDTALLVENHSTVVPEPASGALLVFGLLALAAHRRRKR